jgi:cytochrome c oxidase cbb3-type subunit I/II
LEDLAIQADGIAKTLQQAGVKDPQLNKREIVAVIAYLQRLGTDIKVK